MKRPQPGSGAWHKRPYTLIRVSVVTLLFALSACSRPGAPVPPPAAGTNAAVSVITPGEWTQDLDAALKLGRSQNLPLLLNFTGSDWCGVCIQTEKRVFAKPEWKAYAASNILMVALDFPRDKALVPASFRERNEALRKEFGVEGFPTFILIDPGEMSAIGKLGAYRGMTAADMIRDVRHAVRLTTGAVARAEARLPAESQARYRDAIAALRAANDEATAWLATKPKQDDAGKQRYGEFMTRIEALHAEADQIEDGVKIAD